MKYALLATVLALASIALALDGQIGIHDPSTVVLCDGKYYTYGTGGIVLGLRRRLDLARRSQPASRTGARRHSHRRPLLRVHCRPRLGAGNRPGPRPGGNPASRAVIHDLEQDARSEFPRLQMGRRRRGRLVRLASKTPMPSIRASFSIPPHGRLWLIYGSYFGYIRLVELDPKTGKRINPNDKPRNLAINCEASDMMYHDGWYYLLATHGSCCRGADSGYNIRVGRSKKVTGPFLDDEGVDMIQGGGKLLIGSGGRVIGPGHFGLLDLGEGVQKFSMHWEADLDRGGASVLDIRPLLWKDGWPVAGENVKEGTYEIESVRTGTALELAVEGVPVGGPARPRRQRRRWRRTRPGSARWSASAGVPAGPAQLRELLKPRGAVVRVRRRNSSGWGARWTRRRNVRRQGSPIPPQDVAEVSANWPAGNIDTRMANYLCQAQQKWATNGRPQRRRLPRFAVFQDHHRRHGPCAGRHRGRGTGRPARVHRRARTTVAYGPACRRQSGASCRSRFPIPKTRWRFRPWAAVSRRWRSSIRRATSSAGCSRRRRDRS